MGLFEAWIVLALGAGIVVLSVAVYFVQRHDKGLRPGLFPLATMIVGLVFVGRGFYLLDQARHNPVPDEAPATRAPRP
jgi:uncharacterized membrane-anchored protein